MKVNKNIKIFINYFLGPILFMWLSWSIYSQVRNQTGLIESWQQIKSSLVSSKITFLVTVFVLMFINWGIEAYKWMLAVKQIQHISFLKATMAVFSGLAFSISTPNRVGEYLGRVLYMNEGKRIKAVSLTIVGSMSQLIITVLMGLAGLFFLGGNIITENLLSPIWVKTIFYGTLAGLIILTLFYFRLSWLVKIINKLPASRKFGWVIEALEGFNATLLLRFMSLSTGRFFVFTLQYYLLFRLFGVEVNFWQTWMTVSVMFLIMAIIPSIALFTDLGLKNEIILKLLGVFSANHLGISLSSLSIWIINLVIPALIGSLLILGINKIFKNNNEGT